MSLCVFYLEFLIDTGQFDFGSQSNLEAFPVLGSLRRAPSAEVENLEQFRTPF